MTDGWASAHSPQGDIKTQNTIHKHMQICKYKVDSQTMQKTHTLMQAHDYEQKYALTRKHIDPNVTDVTIHTHAYK